MIANVNGTDVTAADIEQEVKSILAQYQQQVPPEELKKMLPEIQKQAVESVINRQLLCDEADRQNIAVDSSRVQEEINTIAGRFPSREAFEQQLKSHNISLEQMERDLGQQFRLDKVIRNYVDTKDINVADNEVKDFYDANPDSFQSPEQVRASHILLKIEENDTPDVKTQKRLEMAGIIGRIEKGADFEQLAQNHSDCPSKQKGGDLGMFGRGAMVKPFEDAAFSMNPGDLSDIVETQFGFHVIKVTEKSESKKEEFETVKDQILNHLIATKEQVEFRELIKGLRDKADITYAAPSS